MAADPGVVEVYGYQWSKVYKVNLDDLQGSTATVNGEQVTVYGLLEILEDASDQQSPANKDFNLQTLPEIEIALPGGGSKVTYSGSQIRSGTSNVATFYVNDQNVTVMRVPGRGPGGSVAEFEYGTLNPQLYVPKQDLKNFEVSITPASSTVKTGTKVTFTAKPKGLASGASVSYRWTVNGALQPANGRTLNRTFSGNSGDTFYITVTATANGYTDATGAAQVSIDKPAKKPQKEDKKPKENQASGGKDSGTYDPGYIPGYTDPYGGSGTGTGGGSPSTGSPAPANPEGKPQDQQPPADQGQTVTGQLIDPSQIATVVPPADTPATATEPAPAEDSGGGLGSLPTGVKAAFGIGALLGLGGLAEAGAFTGRFRRLRP